MELVILICGVFLLSLVMKHYLLLKVTKRLNALTHDLYFHKMPLTEVRKKRLFKKIARMDGDGLCYESAALTMLAMKGEESSRLVIVEAFNHLGRGHFKHGYVEVKMHGIWWVIDHAWYMYPRIRLRAWNNFLLRVKYIRIVPHSEFWQIQLANDYREAMRKKDTSDIFWYLSAFRHIHRTRDCFDFEVIGEKRFKLQTEIPACMINNYNISITPELIKELLT